MTVSSVIPVNNHTGNSSVQKFDFDFLIEASNELIVQHTDKNGIITVLEEGKDYSINEIGNPEGSYITFPLSSSSYKVLGNDETISLMLDLTIQQESEFGNSLYFDLNILERTFDYIVRILQIFSRRFERCVKVNEGSGIKPDKLLENIKESEVITVEASKNAREEAEKAKNFFELTEVTAENALENIKEAEQNSLDALSDAEQNALDEISLSEQTTKKLIQITADENINEMSEIRNNARDWATKTDGMVDGENYSAKYYALMSQNIGAVSYKQLRASSGYENKLTLLYDKEGYESVLEYARSTFDKELTLLTGTPDLSDEGILSGCSSADFVSSLPVDVLPENNIKIKARIIINSQPDEDEVIFLSSPSENISLILTKENALKTEVKTDEDAKISAQISFEDGMFEFGQSVDIEFLLTKSGYEFTTVNYNGYEQIVTGECEINSFDMLGSFAFGKSERTDLQTLRDAQLDLKYFKLYCDDECVISFNKTGTDIIDVNGENVSVSYIKTKTGSKVVNANFREKLYEIYKQNGYLPYYTLDENDKSFTLPAGEIYGMIGRINDYTPDLFDIKLSLFQVNNPSWVNLAGYSWLNNGYKTAYNELEKRYFASEKVRGNYMYNTDIILAGKLSNKEGVLSGFSVDNYAVLPDIFAPEEADWEIMFKVKIPAELSATQYILGSSTSADYQGVALGLNTSFKPLLYLTGNGTGWNIASGVAGANALVAGNWYYLKLTYDSETGYTVESSNDKETWTREITVSGVNRIITPNVAHSFGIDTLTDKKSWGGEIDLKECYIKISDEIFWQSSPVYFEYYYNPEYKMKIITPDEIEKAEYCYERTGAQPYFIIDSENKQFKLPRFKIMPQITDAPDEVGEYIKPGLPALYGKIPANMVWTAASDNGPLSTTSVYGNWVNGNYHGQNYVTSLTFDASKCSAIYGNSDTVQPAATKFCLYMYLGESTVDSAKITGKVLENINNKIDNDMGNLSLKAKRIISRLSAPSEKYDDLVLGVTGVIYVAPDNGRFVLSKLTGTSGQYIKFVNGAYETYDGSQASAANLTVEMRAKKGDAVKLEYSAAGETNFFRFIYDEGVKEETNTGE